MNQKQKLTDIMQQQNISLTDSQIRQLILFYELLVEKNKVMNLTAITGFEEVCIKHFADSLSICRLYGSEGLDGLKGKLIDVGCGAGFPGLVLAIACPNLQVTLLDSLQKRVRFLWEAIEKLALANCVAIHSRAEEAAHQKEHRARYDLAVSRAVAGLSTLSEYCLPFVREGGLFVAYKSARIKEEAPAAENAIRLLGGAFEKQIEFYLPKTAEPDNADQNTADQNMADQNMTDQQTMDRQAKDNYRNLYVIRKTQSTPSKYPRKAPLPAREPLKTEI